MTLAELSLQLSFLPNVNPHTCVSTRPFSTQGCMRVDILQTLVTPLPWQTCSLHSAQQMFSKPKTDVANTGDACALTSARGETLLGYLKKKHAVKMCPPAPKDKCLAQMEWWFTFQYQIVGLATNGSEWVQIKVHAYNLKKLSQHFCSISVCPWELFPSCLRVHSCPAPSFRSFFNT